MRLALFTMFALMYIAVPSIAAEPSERLDEAWRVCNTYDWGDCRQHFETLSMDDRWHLYSVYMPAIRRQYLLDMVQKGTADPEDKIGVVDTMIREMMFATAESGHLLAQVDVARHHRYVRRDLDEALRWLERVAATDNVPEDLQLTPVFARDEIERIHYQRSRAYFDTAVIGIFVAVFLMVAVFGKAAHAWDRVARIAAILPVTLNLFLYLAASHAQFIHVPELYLPDLSPAMFHGYVVSAIVGYGLLIRLCPSRRFMWVSLAFFLLQIGAVYVLALVLSGLASQGAGH